MNIRSVTCFVNVQETLANGAIERAGAQVSAAREAFRRAGYTVQTTRLAAPPLHRLIPAAPPLDWARGYAETFHRAGFDYGALLLVPVALMAQAPEIIRGTENLFLSLHIASRADGIDLSAIRAAAQAIRALADTTPDGFGNFRMAAAANVPPGVPFFPVAYHDGGPEGFGLAIEGADLAVEAFTGAPDLAAARERLVSAVNREGQRLAAVSAGIEKSVGLLFRGIDFSLAPFPEQERSLATALERLTGAPFGSQGTLFAAAFVTDCLRRAAFPRAGFSGLMLPVLEDWTLAARSRENRYSLETLLLLSTVCGTGLDTVPLAGDTSEEALAALLLDLAALAVRLDKPLTARLIPVPGRQAGEAVRFPSEFTTQARAFAVPSAGRLNVFDGGQNAVLENEPPTLAPL